MSAARRPARSAPDDKLGSYRGKRKFSTTAEPSDSTIEAGRRLIVQRHFATRDHFDLRLEIDGVLVSWAVTRGPSAHPKDKRLAVRTEDHPLDYALFEGVIAPKNYGAGAVILWEATTYEPLNGPPSAALEKGEIKFRSLGQRLCGAWVLVRMKPEPPRENWLLIKEKDAFAEGDDSLAGRYDVSIASGRNRSEIEGGVSPRQASSPIAPLFRSPELCVVANKPPTGDGWLYEMKYDGYRMQIARRGGALKIYSRNGLDWTERFPRIANAARGLACSSAIIDGEAVVFNAKGISDFAALVAALDRATSAGIEFVAFDLLELNAESLIERPLLDRKSLLRQLLPSDGPLRYADFLVANGPGFYAGVIAAGGEGIVAKRTDAPYREGRAGDWVKIKSASHEDVVVFGHMPSTKGETFASLLAASRSGEGWTYVGRIGTGFGKWRKLLNASMAEGTVDKPPEWLAGKESLPAGARFWRKPITAEVAHAGFTGDGRLRQARLFRLREDMPPNISKPAGKPPTPVPPVKVTHANRIIFSHPTVTKGDIAAYYHAVAPRIAPHLEKRAVSLLRAPEGVDGEQFFQRHPLKGMTKGIFAVSNPSGEQPYFGLDGDLGLLTATQFGAIEIHGRMVRTDAPDAPDRVIFDLDPDESVPFEVVREAAAEIRDILASAGLQSYPLLSGGKGVHIVAPLDCANGLAEVEAFASGIAGGLARQKPENYVATMAKARRKGKIFIDWMRNKRGAMAILPWSLRARAGAPVATPMTWAGLAQTQCANQVTIFTALEYPDEWGSDFFAVKQSISKKVLAFLRNGE
jgi:bifunctional non-homologous end joining protein LigD